MEFNTESLAAIEWAFVLCVVFFAFIARGFTGLGSSALCVAFLTFVMPPAVAVILTMMLEMPAGIALLPGVRRDIDIKWLSPTVVGVFIGTPAGLWVLATADEKVAQICIYALMIFFVSANIIRRKGAPLIPLRPFAAGVVAGAANGVAAIAGLVAAVFLLSSDRAAKTVRASLIALFIFSDLYSLLWGAGLGLFRPAHGVLFLAMMPPLLAGVFVGNKMFAKSDGKHYRPLVLGIILFASVAGVLRLLVS